jgi:hypothetical protein
MNDICSYCFEKKEIKKFDGMDVCQECFDWLVEQRKEQRVENSSSCGTHCGTC